MLAASSHETQTVFPVVVVVDEQHVDLIRVEKSLHSLGFFASTTTRESSRTVVQIFRRPNGQRIQAKAVIEGIPSLGLPTTADRDKYMALMKLALDQRDLQGQLTNPIHFTGADLIKLLRLRKGGFHYDEINDWCKRMVATTIMSEASIFLADRRQYANDTFHVFDRVVLIGEELHDGTRSEFYQVYLSHWQITNLNQGYLLPLDFNAYLALHRDIAKALFGHLSVWFYASRGQPVEKKYPDLCQLLHIRAYPYLSKAKAVLEPSLQELTEIGYLASWDLIRTTQSGEFKLLLSPGSRLLSLPNFTQFNNPEAIAALEPPLPPWVEELVKRGVVARKARQLALEVAANQKVLDQIEYAEHLIQQDRRGRGKISNPAGFYVWAIEENLYVPDEFETSEKSRLRKLREQEEVQHQTRELEMEAAYEEFCHEQVRKRFEAEYPPDRLDAAIQEHLKAVSRDQPEWFKRAPEFARREVAISRMRAQLRENLDLPAFEKWAKRSAQQKLFS